MQTIHYCPLVEPEFSKSWAKCGRLVPNKQAYTDDGPEISCGNCLAVIRREDRKRLARRVRVFGY